MRIDRFSSPPSAFVVIEGPGAGRRADGGDPTPAQAALLAGRDPLDLPAERAPQESDSGAENEP